jgi:hypothetical protein
MIRVFVLSCLLLLGAVDASAFKLKALGGTETPAGTTDRQMQGFLQLFTSDVHEQITRRTYEVAGVKLTDDVMTGVRWNDNPPAVRLGSVIHLDRVALEALIRREKSFAPLRSHFGDMQFLHAMAPHPDEPAGETREKILRWAEFAYRVARGEIGANVKLHGLEAAPLTLAPATARFMAGLFASPEKQLWSVQELFATTGQGRLESIAFGTFLHLVQDSYSASHVLRVTKRVQANGCPSYDAADPIIEFHTYGEQDTEKHAVCDDAPDWLISPRAGSPIDVMAQVVRAYHNGAQWSAVKPILEKKVFALAQSTHAARAGRCFERTTIDPERATITALDPSCREEGK